MLDKKYSLQLSFRGYKHRKRKIIKEYDAVKKRYIRIFLKQTKRDSDKQVNLLIDSIFKNIYLLKPYLDSAENYQFKLDSIRFLNKKDWTTDTRYIYFHSQLMAQRSYDTIRAYYDRYYENSTEFETPVLTALINMGDPLVRAKFDRFFNKKYSSNSITWSDVGYLFHFTHDYKYLKLAQLLDKDYSIYTDSELQAYAINGYIAFMFFPKIDTLSYEMYLKKYNEYIGDAPLIKKHNQLDFKLNKSHEEIKEYFINYAEYEKKKKQVLYDKIKYKTSEK